LLGKLVKSSTRREDEEDEFDEKVCRIRGQEMKEQEIPFKEQVHTHFLEGKVEEHIQTSSKEEEDKKSETRERKLKTGIID